MNMFDLLESALRTLTGLLVATCLLVMPFFLPDDPEPDQPASLPAFEPPAGDSARWN
jgi:hypothetical protein